MFIVTMEGRKIGRRVWCVDDDLAYWGEPTDKYVKHFDSQQKAEKVAKAVFGKVEPA